MISQNTNDCPVETTVKMIGGKWKIIIIARLIYFGQYRFSKLKRSIPTINERMLSRQLRELEEDGLIFRKVYAEVPPRVEYGLTENGKTLIPVLQQLAEWGTLHQKQAAKGATTKTNIDTSIAENNCSL